MAQYSDLIAGLAVGSYGDGNGTISGWSQLWTGTNESNRSYEVVADASAPSGKKLVAGISTSNLRTLLQHDASASDPDRNKFEIIALVQSSYSPIGTAGVGHGIGFGASGGQASEIAYVAGLGRSSSAHVNRMQRYNNGTPIAITNSGSINSVTGGETPQLFWIRVLADSAGNVDGVSTRKWRQDAYAVNDLDGTSVGAIAGTTLPPEGVFGLFGFYAGSQMEWLYVAIGTGLDPAPRPSASTIPVSFSGSVSSQTFAVGDEVDVNLTLGFSGTETPFTYTNTGTSLSGSGLSINSAGHLVGTAIESEIVGVVVTATDTATNSASSNAFNISVLPAGTDLEIDTVFDLSNISSVSSSVTAGSSSEPIVFLAPRDETMSTGGNWRNLVGKVTGCTGKRPIFRFDRTTQDSTTTTRDTLYRICWTTDFVTFNQFPLADVTSGIGGYYQVQADTSFTDDVVYVMTNPMYPQSHSDTFAASLLTTYSSVASPTDYAVAAKVANPSWPTGAVFVTDAANDYPVEAGEAMSGVNLGSLPIYGFKLDWGASEGVTTDGGPKRKAVLTYGQHAQGEAQASISYFGALTWLLTSSDTQAVNLRRNFIFFIYFNINGSGISGGHRRLSYGTGSSNTNRSQDFNRVWDMVTPSVPEVRFTRDAVLADTAGAANVLLDWHGKGDAIGDYNSIESSVFDTANNTIWNTLAATHFDMSNAEISTVDDTGGYIITWANQALNVDYATHAEHANRGNNSKANLELVGQNWLRTLQSADSDGMFYSPPPEITCSIQASFPEMIASAALTDAVPSFTAALAAGLPLLTASAHFNDEAPSLTMSMSAGLPALIGSASFSIDYGQLSMVVNAGLPNLTGSVEVSDTTPSYTAQVVAGLPALTVAAEVVVSIPGGVLFSVSAGLPALTGQAAFADTVPGYNAQIAAGLPQLTASAVFTIPALTIVVSAGLPQLTASAVVESSVSEMFFAVDAGLPTLTASAAFTTLQIDIVISFSVGSLVELKEEQRFVEYNP